MGLFDFFRKKKTAEAPAAAESKADAITAAASAAAEQQAEEMDELTRVALAAGVESKSEGELTADELINKALNAIQSDDNATAIRCFRQAMAMGSLEAKMNVARCYETGRGVSKDEPHAFKLYRDAAAEGHLGSHNSLGNCYINGIGTPKDPAKGYEVFLKAAEAGEAVAMANVAKCLMQGVGTEQNEEEGLKWFAKSAEAGNADADFELGMIYLQTPEYSKHAQEGFERVRKAAENGNMNAVTVMAQLHDEQGPLKNVKECVKWLTAGAEKGDKHAQLRLGQIYMFGRGVPRDAQKGYQWITFSAQQNYIPAIYTLAELNIAYTRDNVQALQQGMNLLTQCIKESYPPAFMLMGQCLLDGRGVAKDAQRALKFFHLAAQNGNPNADLILAKIYNGEIEETGIETQPEEARECLLHAAEKGHPVALHDLAVMDLNDEHCDEAMREKAAERLRAAANAGYTPALKTMTEYGISVQA